jgi:hypothetical protein
VNNLERRPKAGERSQAHGLRHELRIAHWQLVSNRTPTGAPGGSSNLLHFRSSLTNPQPTNHSTPPIKQDTNQSHGASPSQGAQRKRVPPYTSRGQTSLVSTYKTAVAWRAAFTETATTTQCKTRKGPQALAGPEQRQVQWGPQGLQQLLPVGCSCRCRGCRLGCSPLAPERAVRGVPVAQRCHHCHPSGRCRGPRHTHPCKDTGPGEWGGGVVSEQ